MSDSMWRVERIMIRAASFYLLVAIFSIGMAAAYILPLP
jgi:hypothetical protein